jgi:hypothetical protein
MAPINTPNGNEVSEIILPNGNTASEVIAPDGTQVFGATPDSVVSRPNDDSSDSRSDLFGCQIETSETWPEIGARISANTASQTRAYIFRVSDGQLMGDVDISALSAGDTFTINLDAELVSGETYNFVVDAEGPSYTRGFLDPNNSSFPYTSSDGNLSIVNGAQGQTGDTTTPNCINDIGNTGF